MHARTAPATTFEQGPILPVAFWVLLAISVGASTWAIATVGVSNAPPLVKVVVILLAWTPFLFFGAPQLSAGRCSLRVDEQGVWRDGALLVAADDILAIGVHVRRVRGTGQERRESREGRRVVWMRLHDLGKVLIDIDEFRARTWLWTRLTQVVVVNGAIEQEDDGAWRAHALHVPRARGRELVEALLAVATWVDTPTQILEPEMRLGVTHQGTRVVDTDFPPLEDWTWDDDTELVG